MSDVVVVLTTVAADAPVETLAQTLVEEKLAACINVLPPMTSIYQWNGAVEQSAERQLIMKTTRALVPLLETRLKELHSYELPEFIVLAAEAGNPDYLAWVAREVRQVE